MSTPERIAIEINGRPRTLEVPAHRTLLEALRELGCFEVKSGCEKGDCGACAVLVDGVAVDACLTLARTVDGCAVTTAVGLGTPEDPHPLQAAFVRAGAVQCGYCTPGLLAAAKELLDSNPDPDEPAIRLALSGNLCRCTGYTKVFDAVREAAAALREAGRVQS